MQFVVHVPSVWADRRKPIEILLKSPLMQTAGLYSIMGCLMHSFLETDGCMIHQ